MRHTGLIKFFGKNRNNKKMNFGFITRDNGNEVYINKDHTGYTLAELAERLGLEESVIEAEKLNPNLSISSSSKDPNSIQWEYLSETNNFYPIDLPEGMRVTFEVITNTEKGKDEAKSLRILLKQNSIANNFQSNQIDNINTNINAVLIDEIDLNLITAYHPLSKQKQLQTTTDSGKDLRNLPPVKRVSTVHFIYCLYLEKLDAIYWGMTSNLTQRMKQHYEGEVRSTCEEAEEGKIWILYTLPFRSREDAENAEQQAWLKSGGGVIKNYDYLRDRQTFQEVQDAGTVKRMDFAYLHLINLGWVGTKIKLLYFFNDTSKYLQLWDGMTNYTNHNVFSEIFDTYQTKQNNRNKFSQQKSESPDFNDNKIVKKLRKNEAQHLVQYYAYLNDQNQEVISGVITTPLIIANYQDISPNEISILHLDAYETKEEAQKALENVDYQIPNIYRHLLNHGWNGRRFNIKLLLSAFSQMNKIHKCYSNYPHNERLKILRKHIIMPHKDEESYEIANLGRRLSTSANIGWRTLLFIQEWLDIYEDYELQNQRVNSSDSKSRRSRLEEQERIDVLKELFLGNSNTSNISDQAVVKSDEPDDIDYWANMTI